MSHVNFSKISDTYEKNSVIQKSAGEKVFDLVSIGEKNDVLDLGCGTGYLTNKIRNMTAGKVVGIDPEGEMIAKARGIYGDLDITFRVSPAEKMDYREAFDAIYCNSAFQWFRDPVLALRNIYLALRVRGWIGIQAAACRDYCPVFLRAIDEVKKDPETRGTFSHFKEPWFFLETAEQYTQLFEASGLKVPYSKIEKTTTINTAQEVLKVFDSGAAAGYLNQAYYSIPLNKDYTANFRDITKKSFNEQADSRGNVELTFNRIYLLACK